MTAIVLSTEQGTQEGQQPALNTEVVLPAFARHYGYPAGAREIEFFTERERGAAPTAYGRRR